MEPSWNQLLKNGAYWRSRQQQKDRHVAAIQFYVNLLLFLFLISWSEAKERQYVSAILACAEEGAALRKRFAFIAI